jgi:hypothetical protein
MSRSYCHEERRQCDDCGYFEMMEYNDFDLAKLLFSPTRNSSTQDESAILSSTTSHFLICHAATPAHGRSVAATWHAQIVSAC